MNPSLRFDFQCDVLEQSHDMPVLVDFWAEGCAPCSLLAPVLQRLAEKHAGRFSLVKINTEEYPDIATKFQIRSIPTVLLFSAGEVTDSFSGALPEYQIEEWLKKNLPGAYAKEIALAGEFVRDGKRSMALSVLDGVMQKETGNVTVHALLAKLKLFSSPQEALQLSELLEAEPEHAELSETIRTLARLLSAPAKSFPDDESRAGYLDAIEKLRREDLEGALEWFISVLRQNRSYDDDGSRKACIAIFRYLGEEHDITQKYRKTFDRAF
ncbi:MAG: tetratricopeptide repeat protein [Candidatus Chlorobium antarcticum]|jgi:putative thioredoxin|nr:tetratricopeptide repeat protein [Candidatus Chlorobium antarcticum]